MKFCKVCISLILAIAICLSVTVNVFATDSTQQYTTVLIHGLLGWGEDDAIDIALPYWGLTSGSVKNYLNKKGYNVVVASVGPVSSCWDRTCELYAQLTGTKTDYGAAHTAECNADFNSKNIELTHTRYGRDYTGKAIVENWGPGIDNKLNLVGHSFGGPTSMMLLHLLAEGDEAEREYAKEQAAKNGGNWKDYCSPLFWGDYHGENLINSVTSLAGVLNGTTFIDSCDTATQVVMRFATLLANAIGDTLINKIYDFQLEHFGLTGSDTADFDYTLDLIKAYKFLDGKDNAIYDLSIEGCNELKQGWKTYDNVFYFAFAGNTTYKNILGTQSPTANTWFVLTAFASFMGSYTNKNEVVLDTNGNKFCVIDKDWLSNDGLVNTVASRYVFGHAHKDWDGKVEPGIWITMPLYGYDHLDFCGGFVDLTQNTVQTKAFFDEVINNIVSTYSYFDRLEAPVLKGASKSQLLKSYVELTWNKIDGADKYRIYKASSLNGSYKLLDTVSSTSLKDYSTVRGLTYYYKIIAVKNGSTEITSPMSNILSVRVK